MQHVTNWPLAAAKSMKLPRGFYYSKPKPTETISILAMIGLGLVGIWVTDDTMSYETALTAVWKAAGHLPPEDGEQDAGND